LASSIKYSGRFPAKKFKSAALLSRAVKKAKIKSREEYLAVAKEKNWPLKPERFGDWPYRVDNFTAEEAWQIFFGTFNERRINAEMKEPTYYRCKARKDLRASGKY
jgi:hypothetical protein